MRVIISAGGTGGHIYPALAILDSIKEQEPDSTFLYIGTHNRMEKDIVPLYNIPYQSIEVYGFNRRHILKNFKTLSCLLKANKKCKKIIKDFKPDVVIGVGGYVTFPVIKAAHNLGIKTVIHEQNSIVGKANTLLKNIADLICVSMKSSIKYFPKEKTIFTGNPVSEKAIKLTPALKSDYNLDNRKKLVLCVMGSLGATNVNAYLKKELLNFNSDKYEFVYLTGKSEYEEISKIKFPSSIKVFPYIDNLPKLMKCSDIIVSRSGASTLSEIIALNIPSILIPSPYVPNNHQYKNALDLVNSGCALLLEEKDLKNNILKEKIEHLLNDQQQLKEMKLALKKMYIPNSADKIYENIKKVIGDTNEF